MILFFISLLICIFLHELSHLIVAKKCGCGVDVFSVGFWKPFYRKEYKGTIYQITPLLLGGYCKLHDELTLSNDKDSFSNLPYLKKFYIAIAGCIINIITGFIALFLGMKFLNYPLWYFGYLSIILGITNLLPIPALDGGYIIYLPICIKIWGKEKGFKIFAKINKISFIILMALNIACTPLLIYLIQQGGL